MATVVYGDFEWDDAKAEANMRKHGVSFDEAATAFEDPNHLIVDDGSGDGLLGLSREVFRGLVLPAAWVKNPRYSTAPKVGVYDPCSLVEISRALRNNRAEWLAQCRAFVSRRREQIDADVRVEHEEFMMRARSWQQVRRERVEERRYWARAAGTRTDNVRGDQP